MKVFYYDKIQVPAVERELNAKRIDKETLFAMSDFISINLPLLPETHHLINADLLKLMKPTSFLINLARGPVWKEEDVIRFLKDKKIAGVGSDVYEVEPAAPDHPLFRMDNFVGTPHSAAHTDESAARSSMVASDVLAILEGREPQSPVL
jgi:phosphoglycerate dehydrogenase-like enzyme